MNRMMCWCVGLLLVGCVATPSLDPTEPVVITPGGVFVLCEGLWQQNNAVLSYLSPKNAVERDVVSAVNSGMRLGDTASDILHLGDSLYIVVSTSKQIVVLDAASAELSSTVSMPSNTPFHLATDGGEKIYVTNLGDDSITELRTAPLRVSIPRLPVGPAPDGICVLRGNIYIALSGLGDLRRDEQGSGTITILRQSDLSVTDTIDDVPNVGKLVADASRDRVWGVYRNFISQPDSLGGVVMINGTTQKVASRWTYRSPTDIALDPSSGIVYVLHEAGIDAIDAVGATSRRVIEHVSGNGADVWYAIGFDSLTGHILIGNARSFVTDGEVIELTEQGAVVSRTSVGVNPTAFTR